MINEIVEELGSEFVQNPCFMLTGARGSGKTVTMTSIEKKVAELDEWIIVRLNPDRDLLNGLVAKLYDSREFLTKFIDTSVNLSKFGIGINISKKSPVADIESALEIILKELKGKQIINTIIIVGTTIFVSLNKKIWFL